MTKAAAVSYFKLKEALIKSFDKLHLKGGLRTDER